MEEQAKEILEKTAKTKDRYEELNKLVSDPDIIADNRQWKKLVKERSAIEDIALSHDRLQKLYDELEDCKKQHDSETDHELKEMFYE